MNWIIWNIIMDIGIYFEWIIFMGHGIILLWNIAERNNGVLEILWINFMKFYSQLGKGDSVMYPAWQCVSLLECCVYSRSSVFSLSIFHSNHLLHQSLHSVNLVVSFLFHQLMFRIASRSTLKRYCCYCCYHCHYHHYAILA